MIILLLNKKIKFKRRDYVINCNFVICQIEK